MCKSKGPVTVIGQSNVTQNQYFDGRLDLTISFSRDLEIALRDLARKQYPNVHEAYQVAKLVKTWIEDQADLDLNE